MEDYHYKLLEIAITGPLYLKKWLKEAAWNKNDKVLVFKTEFVLMTMTTTG
jgi:hypothetical protein